MTIRFDRLRVPATAGPGIRLAPLLLWVLTIVFALVQTGCMTVVVDPSLPTEAEKLLFQAEARRDLGMDYLAKGHNAIALRELVFAAKSNPKDPKTQLWLGEGYRRQRHNDKALAAMLRAIEIKPDYQEAHNNLSAFYLQLERYEDAIAHAQILIDDPLYPWPWTAYSNRGRAELSLGRIDDARESLQMALEFRRDFWPASLNLGILEREAGNTLKAVKHLRRVIKHPIGHGPRAEASFHVAQILISMGRREKAMKYFAVTVRTDPEGPWAEESRDYLKVLR